MFFLNRMCKIQNFLFILLIICLSVQAMPWKFDFFEISEESESEESFFDELFSVLFDDSSEEISEETKKLGFAELCSNCNISYIHINSTQYINYYHNVTTEKKADNVKPTPIKDTSREEEATKNCASQTKDNTSASSTITTIITNTPTTTTTVSPKDIMITTTARPITTTTNAKVNDDVPLDGDIDSDANVMSRIVTTTTTTTLSTPNITESVTTMRSVDMTSIPPAPVPLDEEPLLDPSDKMPSEEALTSEGNV